MSDLSPEMIERLEAGDDHAFVELFTQHRHRLKQMMEIQMDPRLRGREDASDILQEVYLDAHQRIKHYLKTPEMSFYVWLRRLAMQRLIDIHRRHLTSEKRNVKQEVSLDRRRNAATSASLAFQLVGRLASPSQIAIQAEMIRQVEQALEKMGPIDRDVLALRHFEELRNSEVAEVLNIKEAAASNRYMRALTRLRDTLEQFSDFLGDG